jgi:predicted dehydrogenase
MSRKVVTAGDGVLDMDPAEATFLVVGCGSIGQRHLRNLSELSVGRLVGVDPDAETREQIQDDLDIPVDPTLEEGLAREPDVAVVCVPNNLHVDVAITAAEAGCHLFIEKPLSHTQERVDELCDIVDRQELRTMVACNMRFHPCIQKIRELVTKDVIGDIVAVRAEAGQYLPDWHPEEDYRNMYSANREQGGGAILDFIHEIDYVRWLVGPMQTVSCFASSATQLEIETEDTAGILLESEDEAICEIHVDYVQREYSRSCHVIGEDGVIRWDWQSGSVSWTSASDGIDDQFSLGDDWEVNAMYRDEMRHFLRVLAEDRKPTNSVTEGAMVLDIALAAKESARSGKHVPLGGDHPRDDDCLNGPDR